MSRMSQIYNDWSSDLTFYRVGHDWLLSTEPPEGAEGPFRLDRTVVSLSYDGTQFRLDLRSVVFDSFDEMLEAGLLVPASEQDPT